MIEKKRYLPRTVRLLGVDYTVVDDPGYTVDEDITLYGEYFEERQEIYVNPSFKFEVRAATLLHEILEGINSRCELKLRHPQITMLEAALVQVLSDNPRVLTLFKKVDEEDIPYGTK